MRLAPIALLLAAAGCIVVPAQRAPPPRPAQLLTEQQAVDVAASYVRAHGQQVLRTTRAFLDARARWHIDLVGPNNHANLLVDSVSGRVLKARLRVGPPPSSPPPGGSGPGEGQAPGRERDNDWDE